MTSCVEPPRISPAIRPSCRNTTRSAMAAADGSCVTITTVRPSSRAQRPQQREHLAAGPRVEVARRLVGEQQRRRQQQRPRDRDALLLAAGELGGHVLGAVAEPDAGQQRVRALAERAGRAVGAISAGR